jgi:translation initiation factor IF-3
MIGVLNKLEAMNMARQAGLDLVEVAPNSDPPVCKILDFGKYKYEQQKKKAEARKKQKVIEVKEVQMRPMIDDNDFMIKCRSIERFLKEGDKVKISLRFRGRELSHQELGIEVLEKVKALFEATAKIEFTPRLEGRQMIMILTPR